jgi:hypothetical protein
LNQPDHQAVAEAAIVTALRKLSVFSADQAGAYREHYADLSAALGPDVTTKLARFLERWAAAGKAGAVLLTGNAGTGKTAAAETYCRSLDSPLPTVDLLTQIVPGRWVLKDLSGVPTAAARAEGSGEGGGPSQRGPGPRVRERGNSPRRV